ncbi:RNA polymerase sigma factor [Mycobacterium sp. pR1184]|uniref:RNA polymerase sigma factor n=1 Tax=Mycobacterium sp. pR1184 TaxID=3238981 RepID=UPI00351BD87C
MSEVSGVDIPDEAALVEAAKQGDRQAMNQLLARHFKTVDTLCRRMLRNSLDAEDARQEALKQAAHRISTFEGRSSFKTWIYAVTSRVCLNEIEKITRHPTTPFDDEFDGSSAPVGSLRHDRRRVPRRPVSADDVGRVSQRLDIDAAMREVSPAYHSVLVMYFFGDMSLADIAARLDIPINTVKTRLFKGKAQLAKLLGEPDDPTALSNQGSG